MDFTERMLERNRSRYNKLENKEGVTQSSLPLKEVHHNTVTTIASTSVDFKKQSGSNKVTIETTVTMQKHPKRTSSSHIQCTSYEDESSCTEGENESTIKKQNETQQPECPLRQDTKSRLQRLGVLYSDDPSRLSSPIHRTEEHFVVEDKDPATPNVKSSARSARLAALAKTINNWEDDIRHHPVGERSGLKSPTKTSVLTKHTCTNKNANEAHRKFISPQKRTDAHSNEILSRTTSVRNQQPTNSKTRNQSPEKTFPSILKHSDTRLSPQWNKNTKSTKSIVWDKTVIEALEAQGFSRSESSKRIIYDYNKDKSETSTINLPATSSTSSIPPFEKSQSKLSSPVNSKSPVKVGTSPVKGRYGSPIQMGKSATNVKENVIPREESPVPTMGVKQLCAGSVLDKAQRYEEATSPPKRSRDPAELPLAERLALFERNAGAAVLPKAPFAMPVPANKLHIKPPNQLSQRRQVPSQLPSNQATGSTCSLHDRLVVFEKGSANTEKDHMKDILSERQKEIEMLNHRFDRFKRVTDTTDPEHDFKPSAPPPSPPPPPPLPSPPPQYEFDSGKYNSGYCNGDEMSKRSLSPKREDLKATYPVLKNVKKITLSPPKPGCIYPCLSDMEVESEAQESELEESDNNRSSSGDTSNESDISSLGQNIVKMSRSSLKRDWLTSDHYGNEEKLDNEIDDFLDEALDDSSDEPTPPKRSSYSHNVGSVQSRSFEYSQHDGDCTQPSHPLLHTISIYRKQQNMTVKPPSSARLIQIDPSSDSTDDSIERMEEELDRELKLVEQKIDMLQQEVKKQQNIISQSTQALNLCYSTIEFSGSTEQLEAEKLLLVATQRRQAALHEIQRLRVEQTIRPQSPGNKTLTERGSLTLSQITLPLKMDIIHQAAKEDQCYYLLCLVHSEERVLCTDVMCAPRSLHSHNKLTFSNTLTLDGLYSDFKVTLEIYTMTARNKELIPHDVKYHINTNKKDASKLKLTPRKGKGESKLLMPLVQSPGGPTAVRTSSFSRAGYVIFSLREIHRTQFTLNKNAYTSVLEGSLHLKIHTEMSMDVEYRGFLTMFEDVSGFGAWHRRWCLLKGDKLSYWKYPDDERTKIALDTIELSACTTQEVDVVPRDVCARANTFLLETSRLAKPTDVDSLVLIRNGNMTTIRHLLSADTKEERIQWCQHLNKALALMRAWGIPSK